MQEQFLSAAFRNFSKIKLQYSVISMCGIQRSNSNGYIGNLKSLEVQKGALRAGFQDKTISYEERLKNANPHTLNNKRLQDIAILMYKVKNDLAPKSLQCTFERQIKSYNLRNLDFKQPNHQTIKFGKHSIRYLGPMLWSKLSPNIRHSKNLQMFKIQIRRVQDISRLTAFSCKNFKLFN